MPDSEAQGPAEAPVSPVTERAAPVADVGTAPPLSSPAPQMGAWAANLSDRVVEGVGWLRSHATLPALTVLRAAIYGVVVLTTVLTALVLIVLGVVRLWDVYLPLAPVGRRVWLGYVVLGGLMSLAGAVLLLRRKPSK